MEPMQSTEPKKSGRKTIPSNKRLSTVLSVGVTEKLASDLDKLANIQNLSRRDLIRHILIDYVKRNPNLLKVYNTIYDENGTLRTSYLDGGKNGR